MLAQQSDELGLKYSYEQIIGRSPAMRDVLRLVDRVTDLALPVLIVGESGTGKELVARAIHFNGPRRRARIVGENLAQELRGQVVTDNRAGANGIIGVELVVKANPDGYTLLSGSSGNTSLNAALYGAKLPFNVERDLAPVTQVATTTSVVASIFAIIVTDSVFTTLSTVL